MAIIDNCFLDKFLTSFTLRNRKIRIISARDQNKKDRACVELDSSKLKPTTESISLRLPAYLLRRVKELANAKDALYRPLFIKTCLAERVEKERI